MTAFDLTKLKGQFVVLDPPVQSVYAADGRGPGRRELRDWPFLVTDAQAGGFGGDNTTTRHMLKVQAQEVVGISGDLDAPPNYRRPLTVRLNSQVCWDSLYLWREPLRRRRGAAKRRFARHAVA